MQLKKRSKTFSTTLTLSTAAALLLAGCSSSNQAATSTKAPESTNATSGTDSTKGTGFTLGDKPVEFTFYGHYDWYTMPPWGEDAATAWIKDHKKVNVTAIQSGGNAEQKLSTMIASSTLPDVIWLDRGKDVERLRTADMLVPLDDYLEKYPNLKKWAGESTLNLLRSPDGKIYQFPNWYTTRPNGNTGYVVNMRIYNEMGKPKLETFDDLYNYLKAVKAKYGDSVVPYDPGIEGQGVDLLISGFANDYPTSYIANRSVPKGDKLVSIFTDSVYRESLIYANKLYQEKLMLQDALTQTQDQIKEKLNTDRVAVYADSSPTEFASLGDATVKAQNPQHPGYNMFWPMHKEGVDKNKVYPGDWNQLGWNVSVITKSAKDPEAIFAFLDWYTGEEGMRTIFWGPDGLYWNGVDSEGGPQFNDKYFNDREEVTKLMNTTNELQWAGNTVYVDTTKSRIESKLPVEKRNWETRWQTEVSWKTSFNSTQFLNMAPIPDTDEGITAQRIDDIFKEARAQALYAKNADEVNKILDKAEKDAQNAGYEKLLAYQTKIWQNNLKLIGGK
ncbi:extracellular solute-binding protein [Paenibacillus albiflavus]|uniref:Extracellular solute-binding protein n=1 Tax=Paenibacillus albiflavus TaxID=2545760 RepID=A0A4R4E0J7_9BACL|nr:extracellular solute-binding protein [Paenibacillus albiflavus]TCZ72876.1 extracellular solute-binding protein [Paenibacillus albiflavus]